jgi:hypothetical protein
MSWQEELQKLDSALATGRISADDYRRRRDELLAQASGQAAQPAAAASTPQPAAPPAPPALPTPPPPVQPEPPAPDAGQTPFPPAFKWQPDHPDSAESTTIIPPVAPPEQAPVQPMAPYQPSTPESDRTQVVSQQPHSQDAERTQVVSGVDRTQVVPSYATSTPPPGFPQAQQQPPWAQRQQPPVTNAPPWASDELPPGFGSVGTSWPRQGPEIFEEKGSGKGKIIAIVIVVAVLLGAGAAVFFITKGSDNNQAGPPPAATTTPADPTSTAPPTPTGPTLPEGPFVSTNTNGDAPLIRDSTPIDAAIAAKAPTELEAKLLKQAGVASISSVLTFEGQMVRGIWAFTPGSGTDPKAILAAINKEYQDGGHRQQAAPKPGVTLWAFPADANNANNSFRAHFITGGKVVRVEAYGPDATATKDAFDELLNRVTTKFPPTE